MLACSWPASGTGPRTPRPASGGGGGGREERKRRKRRRREGRRKRRDAAGWSPEWEPGRIRAWERQERPARPSPKFGRELLNISSSTGKKS